MLLCTSGKAPDELQTIVIHRHVDEVLVGRTLETVHRCRRARARRRIETHDATANGGCRTVGAAAEEARAVVKVGQHRIERMTGADVGLVARRQRHRDLGVDHRRMEDGGGKAQGGHNGGKV